MANSSVPLILGLAFLASAGSCSRPPDTLSDSAAVALIDSIWNEHASLRLMLGEIRFVRGGSDAAGREAGAMFPLYQGAAEAGLIRISDERDLARNSGGWDDWLELTRSGVQRTASIAVTEQGRSAGSVRTDGDQEVFLLKTGVYRAGDIVANDTFTIASEPYRIVMGSMFFDVATGFRPLSTLVPGVAEPEQRFKLLLKFDRIAERWSLLAADTGPRDRELATHNVEARLAELRSGTN